MDEKKESEFEEGLREILSAGESSLKRNKDSRDTEQKQPFEHKPQSKTALRVLSVLRVLSLFAVLFFLMMFVSQIVGR
ncbi:hypothetical protein CHISP_0834 [Chitinispirillum alkaliphilum]|nr:hypothetical protein CHISP_0834 [Chitinispirillum alkaliphilum]